MRVAYLTSEYPAPSHTFILREVEALRNAGGDIRTFSIRRPAASVIKSDSDRHAVETTTYILPSSPSKLIGALFWVLFKHPLRAMSAFILAMRHRAPGLRAVVYGVFYWLEAVLLARHLSQEGIDHVHNHFANAAAVVGLLATRIVQRPWSLTLHGISEFDYPAGLLLRSKIEAAEFVACASYFIRAQACRLIEPSDWDKLQIVRCGLDLSRMPPVVARTRNDATTRIVCVARLSAEKAHIGLLLAFSEALHSGLQAELVLVGDGPERPHIEQEIERLGIGASCKLLGTQPNDRVLQEIAGSDMLVISSFMEGLPVVLMEALALKIPVIAPRVAGIPELVDSNCGRLFTPTAWNELAAAIVDLSDSAEKRECLGQHGRARIESEFEITRAVEPLVRRFIKG